MEGETGVLDGETTADGSVSVEHVECIGACGGATAVQVNYETIEGVDPDRARALVRWLRDTRPAVVVSDEMQEEFGGRRAFDWGPPEFEGAIGPVPAFAPYGSVGGEPKPVHRELVLEPRSSRLGTRSSGRRRRD